ncbi:MAG: hypothetical protein U5Q44_04510 [Dehalococcoidia bacterium]|nr:hypothetical protein [Dehalococcoidia bacterium]
MGEVTYQVEITNDSTANVTAAPQDAAVTVENTSPAVLEDIQVADEAPYSCSVSGQAVNCANSGGEHPVDEEYTITVTGRVTDDATFDTYSNVMELESASQDLVVGHTRSFEVASTQLEIEKHVAPDPAAIGDTGGCTLIAVTNVDAGSTPCRARRRGGYRRHSPVDCRCDGCFGRGSLRNGLR